jgi:hypothetical protein
MDNNIDSEWDEIKIVLTNPKTPYRIWTNPDPRLTNRRQKQSAEAEVVSQFCEAIEAIEGRKIFKRNVGICEDDPPDAIVEKLDGSKIGVEVTELLDEQIQKERVKAWRDQVKKRFKYRNCNANKRWTIEELTSETQKRIEEKCKREFNGGPYAFKILVVYSVETSVRIHFRDLAATLSQKEFGPTSLFDEIYFLTGQAPMQEHPQLCKLHLKSSLNEN